MPLASGLLLLYLRSAVNNSNLQVFQETFTICLSCKMLGAQNSGVTA